MLAEKYGFERARKWYEQKPEGVIERQEFKVLWDFMVQCDRVIQARRPDVIVVDKKQKEVRIIGIAIPSDCRIKDSEQEKMAKHEQLKEEVRSLLNVKKVTATPVLTGALGCVSDCFESCMEKIGIDVQVTSSTKDSTLRNSKDFKKEIIYVSHKT